VESSCEGRNQSSISLLCNQQELCKLALFNAGTTCLQEALEKLRGDLSIASSWPVPTSSQPESLAVLSPKEIMKFGYLYDNYC
jgi:hypothetical protein